MSTVLATYRVFHSTHATWYLLLDCGHWAKWENTLPLPINSSFPCMGCSPAPYAEVP